MVDAYAATPLTLSKQEPLVSGKKTSELRRG